MNIWEKPESITAAYWQNGNAGFPVYDMHGHMGTHNKIYMNHSTPELMVRHLRRAGIKRLVFSHHYALWTPDFSNETVYELIKPHADILRMYIAVNPNYPERIMEDIRSYDKWAPLAIGFKFLSAYHQTKVDDPRYEPVLKFANERKLPILFHTWGGDPHVPIDIMEKIAQKYPDITFFMGHSFRPDWEGVRRLRRNCPDNVYFELTSIPGTAGMIEKLVEAAGSERLIYGTDLPWFDEFQAIGGVISANISEDDMRNIFYRNVERLLGADW